MLSSHSEDPATAESQHPIYEALVAASRIRPDGWAVRDPGRSLSYPRLLELVDEEAVRLHTADVRRGSLVMIQSTHDIAYLAAYFAALRCGADVMPYDPSAGPREIQREVDQYGVEFVLVPAGSGAECRRHRAPDGRVRMAGPDAGGRVLLPTSGTGGQPKRAVHSPYRLMANAAAHAESVGLSGDDSTLVVLSPAFGYCHTSQILAHVLLGGRIAFPPKPAMPHDLAVAMRSAQTTNTTMVPHLLGDVMLKALSGVSTLRQISIGGAAITVHQVEQITGRLPAVELLQTWGMTECGPRLTTWRAGRDPLAPGCVGRPVPGVSVEARPSSGRAGIGEEGLGELYARTPYAMLGYLPGPGTDADVLVEPDVIRTGDLGFVDADGQVYVRGRIKNLIDVAGKKVSPEEIESVIAGLPGVAAVRVRGRDVPRKGQQPVALIVRTEDAPLEAAEVSAAVREALAPHKWLRDVAFVDTLETTTTGKLRRLDR